MNKKNHTGRDLIRSSAARLYGWTTLAAMLCAPAITQAGPLLQSADVSITVNSDFLTSVDAAQSTTTWTLLNSSASISKSLQTDPDASPDIVLVSTFTIEDDQSLVGQLTLKFDLTATGYSLSLDCTPLSQGGSCEGHSRVTPFIEIAISNMVWDPAAVLTGVSLSGTPLFSPPPIASTSFGDDHYEISFEDLGLATLAYASGTLTGTFLTRALPVQIDEPAGMLLSATALALLGFAGRRWRAQAVTKG